ncbi:hypothetical protein BLNAU_7579 [Blattamonas nauphoetae]|uniref:Uncharacterized protein n=1 Tax=Blattamonas nauphoetae TaxID=2049346 RepID=A0ABQ9Y105_9EUKA|nr:hypothetical protein BLNAU_7579 [Blattamonas nauphoetae]
MSLVLGRSNCPDRGGRCPTSDSAYFGGRAHQEKQWEGSDLELDRKGLHDTPILKSLGNVTGAAEVYHTTWSSELLLDRAPSLTHPRSLASPIPGIMQRKQVCSPYFSFFHHFISFLSGELLLDRAPSLTHPRSLASPIPGIMQRKQVNSCSIVPLPHSSPIVGVADPWHYAAQTGELLLDRAPPSLIPDRWRRRSLALCSANR